MWPFASLPNAGLFVLCSTAFRTFPVVKEAAASLLSHSFRKSFPSPFLTKPICRLPFFASTSSLIQRRCLTAPASAKMPLTEMELGAGKPKHAPFLTDAAQLIASVDTFVFDCDGVIWHGDKLTDRVGETIDLLRDLGKRIFFLTNNSTKSRKQYVKKCERLCLNVLEDEIFSSGFAAVEYLKSINFPADKKVYVISESGLQKELEEAGIQWIGGPEDDHKTVDFGPGQHVRHDHDVGAVVVGFDRYINYYKIQYAMLCIRQNPGCLFIAANCDDIVHLHHTQDWAGEGAIVGAIKGTTSREPIVTGKPSTFMMDYLAEKFKITNSQICMVGDKLDTDILFGQNGGCKTLLVLSGVTDLKTLQDPKNNIQPDFYTQQVSDLLAARGATLAFVDNK